MSNTSNSTKTTTDSTASSKNTPKGEILFVEAGRKATVTAYRPEGSKGLAVVLKSRKKGAKALHIPDASHIDIRSMKAENLQEACAKAAHATGNLSLFEVSEHKGKRARIRVYSNPKTGNGYATLIRKGCKPFLFPLNRVDIIKMKAKSLAEAFEKAVWATGSIAVLPYENTPTTETA